MSLIFQNAGAKCFCGNTISDEENSTNELPLSQTSIESYPTSSMQHVMTFPRSTLQRRSKRLPAVVPEGISYLNDVWTLNDYSVFTFNVVHFFIFWVGYLVLFFVIQKSIM